MKTKKFAVILCMVLLISALLASCSEFINDYDIPIDTEKKEENTAPCFENTAIYKNDNVFSYKESDDHTSSMLSEIGGGYKVNIYPDEDLILMQFGEEPYIYNEKTGELTSVCADPLCKAGKGRCPFELVTDEVRYHNGMYFFQGLGFKNVSYEPATNKVREMWQVQMGLQLTDMIFDGEWCYYYTIEDDQKPDENGNLNVSLSKMKVAFRKQNIYSGETKILKETTGCDESLFLVRDGRCYFVDFKRDAFYYTPEDDIENKTYILENVDTYDGQYIFDDEKIYFAEKTEDEKLATLSSMDYDGGNYTNYGILFFDFLGFDNISVTDKYIYYMMHDSTKVKIGTTLYTRYSPNIWRMNKKTGEKELVVTLSGDLQYVSINQFIVSGRYLYANFDYIADDFYTNTGDLGILRIDVETGEWYYISNEK